MAEMEQEKKEAPYIKEKIKPRRRSPLRWIARVLFCVSLAIIFGAVAGFVFVVVRPWAEQIGIEAIVEEPTSQVVELPTFVPKPSTTQESETEAAETEETTTLDEEQVEFNDAEKQWVKNIVSSMVERESLKMDDVETVDRIMNQLYTQASKSLVTISGYSTEEGSAGQLLWQSTGILFYQIEETDEVLALADTAGITDVGDIRVEIPTLPGKVLSAAVKGWDHIFGLTVLSMSTTSLSKDDVAKISVIEFGNTYEVGECDTVMLIGAPYGVASSVAVGSITYVDRGRMTLDSTYRLFCTDISLPENGSGFMINTDGQLVGILTSSFKDAAFAQYGTAIGMEELMGTLNSMANGLHSSLLGVYGQNVTEALSNETGMPVGVYVTDVQVDGPAYRAGISAGDIITGISMSAITSVSEMTRTLIESHLPEETVIVTVMRKGPEGYKEMEVSVTLGAR